jgi:hypothetical protein
MATIEHFLFDTYKQYKTGTNKVTTWLTNRARKSNLLRDLFTNVLEANGKGKGRLKGKAIAAQKAAQKENGHTYHVPASAIPRIAKTIATMKEYEVPGSIIRTLEEVIAARAECNRCFEGLTDRTIRASNQTHQHFIGVLYETLRILKPLRKAVSDFALRQCLHLSQAANFNGAVGTNK